MSNSHIDSNFEATVEKAVGTVFHKYCTKESGAMTEDDIRRMLFDGYKRLHTRRTVHEDDVKRFLEAVDKNKNGKITKGELVHALRHIAENP
jgi:Ca2+-binding EF-hand superfamily protein